MQSPSRDESPSDPLQALPVAAPALRLSKRQPTLEGHPLSESQASLPYRRSNPSAASLFASTQTPPGSRSMSPVGRPESPARVPSTSGFDVKGAKALTDSGFDGPGDPLSLLTNAYVPHVAVYASPDTTEFATGKGFKDGLWELLRPFGERVQGKVTIRDSNGSSRSWEDYSVRFVQLGDNIEPPDTPASVSKNAAADANGMTENATKEKKRLEDVEALVERHLRYAEDSVSFGLPHPAHSTKQGLDIDATSPYYSLYLRRLLSGIPLSPHESFAHPVACVIAISSRSKSPIEELRQLYNDTRQGDKKLPGWVDGEYLRYYVLVHDEEHDDITRSLSLFDQMKRHLGLHCHLLRLRSSQAAETDDDSIPLPRSDWMTAEEELVDIKKSEDEEDFADPTRHIFESDATAIRTFVREMTTQSIIPTMERHVSQWNDQVASRRRGITGRFMNLSRKWGGFGGGSRSSLGSTGAGAGVGYESLGYFPPDTSEAIMRKLADYAFMLRDWKLAQSTYDLLRSDFSDAKAWKYHAATNEMAALSLLIMPQNMSSRSRTEALDQTLDAAFYSYHTRCTSPFGALRSLILGLELLRMRGGSCVDDAAKWGTKLLVSKIPGPVGDALIKERLAICYATKLGIGSGGWGMRTRKAATWAILGAEAWSLQDKNIQSQRCMNEAQRLYSEMPHSNGISKFTLAAEFIQGLQAHLDETMNVSPDSAAAQGEESSSPETETVDEESEALDGSDNVRAGRRASIIGKPGALAAANLETAPLNDAIPSIEKQNAAEGFESG